MKKKDNLVICQYFAFVYYWQSFSSTNFLYDNEYKRKKKKKKRRRGRERKISRQTVKIIICSSLFQFCLFDFQGNSKHCTEMRGERFITKSYIIISFIVLCCEFFFPLLLFIYLTWSWADPLQYYVIVSIVCFSLQKKNMVESSDKCWKEM